MLGPNEREKKKKSDPLIEHFKTNTEYHDWSPLHYEASTMWLRFSLSIYFIETLKFLLTYSHAISSSLQQPWKKK